MATRSFIIVANPKGDFTGSYCHWDGYPSHNGRILLEHYSSKAKARELIRLGFCTQSAERMSTLDISSEGLAWLKAKSPPLIQKIRRFLAPKNAAPKMAAPPALPLPTLAASVSVGICQSVLYHDIS
jgi:hypothetical protein